MRRAFLIAILLLCSLPALARQKYSGTCQQAGKGILSGLATTNYLGVDYLGASVTVTVVGGGIATLYSDNAGTPLANPFAASGSDGTFGFYADNGRYQVVCSGTGIPTITINSDALLNDPSVATSYTATFFSSATANPSSTGVFRLASADLGLCWRNNLNTADLCFTKTAGDVLQWPSGFSLGANQFTFGTLISNSANVASAGTSRWASADTAKIRNNVNGADLNLWSKNAADVVALGDTAGVSVQGLTNTGNASTTGTETVGALVVTGATTLNSVAVTGNATVGGTLGVTGASTLGVVTAGNLSTTQLTNTGDTILSSGKVIKWNNDTGISRDSAGVLDLGNGTQGNKSGSLNLATLTATGDVTAITGNNQLKAYNFNSVVWLDGIHYTSLAAAYAAIPTATYSACSDGIGTCWTGGGGRVEVPPGWIDPAWAANLVLANNKSIHFNGPAYFNQGTFQVTMANGVHGVSIINDTAADHSQRTSGVVFDYSGNTDQWAIGSAGGNVSNINIENIQLHSIAGGAAAQPLHLVGPIYSTFRHLDLVCSSNGANTGFGLLYDGQAVGENQNKFEGIVPNFCNNPVKFQNNASGNQWYGGIPTCSGGSACTPGSANPVFAIVDSNNNMFFSVNNGPSAGSFASFFNFSGTSAGNEVWSDSASTGSFVTTTVVFGSSTGNNIYHCIAGGCTVTDSASPSSNQVLDPSQRGYAHKAAQVANISATTLLTVGANNSLFFLQGSVQCDSTSAAATVTVTFSFTDVSNTVQTGTSSAAACTALGASSFNSIQFTALAKAGTVIQYSTTIANTPTYDVAVSVTRLGPN